MNEAGIEFLISCTTTHVEHRGADFVASMPNSHCRLQAGLHQGSVGPRDIRRGGFSSGIAAFVDPNRALTYTYGSVSLAGFPLGSAL
jgi:hypothetical protein